MAQVRGYYDEFGPRLLAYLAARAPRDEVEDLKARYRAGKVGDVEVKTKLAAAINAVLEPMRERRRAALARQGYLREVLVAGSRRARALAEETMNRVRTAVRLRY